MKSIKNSIQSELSIKKSTFINYLIHVESLDDVENHLSSLRKDYPDASHHCYAYILGDRQEIQKYSDDGEPSKTAGLPMLEVLKKQGLSNVLNVSIRYFGGIKLGAGGLVRAYTKSCSEAVKLAQYTSLTDIVEIEVIAPFDEIGHIEQFIREQVDLQDTKYDSFVHYHIELQEDKLASFSLAIQNLTSAKASVTTIKHFKRYE